MLKTQLIKGNINQKCWYLFVINAGNLSIEIQITRHLWIFPHSKPQWGAKTSLKLPSFSETTRCGLHFWWHLHLFVPGAIAQLHFTPEYNTTQIPF